MNRAFLCALLFAVSTAAVSGCATVRQKLCGPATPAVAANDAAPSDDAPASCECSNAPAKSTPATTASADEPDEPCAITSEEVSFTSKGDKLTGVIDRPTEIAQPLPAVIVLHDAGPHDRRGVFQGALGLELPVEVPVYQELAEHLAQNGYVVMRFDKRTCVKGGPPWCKYPRKYIENHRDDLASTLIADAKAAIGALRKRDDVDPNRLYIVGHGQGADIALALAKDVDASGLVLLAPSPYPLDKVILHQTDTSLSLLRKRRQSAGNTSEGMLLQQQIDALTETRKKQKAGFAKLRAGDVDSPNALGAPAATWQGLFELHDRAMASLKNTRIPLLAIFGEHDLNLPEDSPDKFRQQLAHARDGQVKVLSGVTHVMVGIDGDPDENAQVSDDVHQAILNFLDHLDQPPPAPSVDSKS